MKKTKGFTVIEVLISMSILGLIMAVLVSLFSVSAIGKRTGEEQNVLFNEARAMGDAIKSTLRYATLKTIKFYDSSNPVVIDSSSGQGKLKAITKMTYEAIVSNKDRTDLEGNPQLENVSVTIEFKAPSGWTKKQLSAQLTYSDDTSRNKTVVFPNLEKNSVFDSNSAFPLVPKVPVGPTTDKNIYEMYTLTLPMKDTKAYTTSIYPLVGDASDTFYNNLREFYNRVYTILVNNTRRPLVDQDQIAVFEDYKAKTGLSVATPAGVMDYVKSKYGEKQLKRRFSFVGNGNKVVSDSRPYYIKVKGVDSRQSAEYKDTFVYASRSNTDDSKCSLVYVHKGGTSSIPGAVEGTWYFSKTGNTIGEIDLGTIKSWKDMASVIASNPNKWQEAYSPTLYE